MDLAVPADHRVKIKGNRTRGKYLDLSRELKKPWNMKVTVIPILIDALGTFGKVSKSGWKGWKKDDEQRPSKLQRQ